MKSTSQHTAEVVCRPSHIPLEGMPELDQAYTNAVAVAEKLYDFPSRAIQSGGNPVICRLSRIRQARLTVKFRNRTQRIILPSDLPSNHSLGAMHVDRWRMVIF
jgi:hypothetical protein